MEPSSKFTQFATPAAVLLGGAFIAGAMIWNNAHPNSQPLQAGSQPQLAVAADVSKVKTAGEPFIGSPNAPVTMAYWYDYQCPFCQRNEEQTMPQIIKDYVDTGKLKIVFKDYQFLGPDSQTLGKFSRAVWEVAPDKFYQWHKAIYDNQGTENTGWATDAKITSITTGVLGASDTAKVAALVKSNGDEYQKEMDADRAEGTAMGISGTPGAIIGKQLISGAQPYAAFQTAIDAALKSQ